VQFGGCRQTIAPHGAPAAGSFRDLDASVSLSFNGECEAAFWADDVPREWREKILFARLRARHMTLLGGDIPSPSDRPPAGFTRCLRADNDAEAERLFAALAEGGTVQMALQPTLFLRRGTAKSSTVSEYRGKSDAGSRTEVRADERRSHRELTRRDSRY
jgi:hypothetical protein